MDLGSFAGGLSLGLQNGMSLLRQQQQMDSEDERISQIKADRVTRDKTRADIAAIPTQVYNADGMALHGQRLEAVPTHNPVLDRQGWMAPTDNYSQPVAVPLPPMERPISQMEYMQRLAPILIQGGDYGTGLQAIQYGNVMQNQDRAFNYQVGRDQVSDQRDQRDYGFREMVFNTQTGQWQQKFNQDNEQFYAGLNQRERQHKDSISVQREGQKLMYGSPGQYREYDENGNISIITVPRPKNLTEPSVYTVPGVKVPMAVPVQNQAIGPEVLSQQPQGPSQSELAARQQEKAAFRKRYPGQTEKWYRDAGF